MNIVNKRKIKKNDWNSFVNWSKKDFFLFGDINFFSGFISINFNEIEKYLIDFYIYNHFILNDKYSFEWPDWLKNNKSENIEEFINNLFKKRFENDYNIFKTLEKFLWNLRKYIISNENDKNIEYNILKEYWVFIKQLRKIENKNHNEWVVYINERIHIKKKGFK